MIASDGIEKGGPDGPPFLLEGALETTRISECFLCEFEPFHVEGVERV